MLLPFDWALLDHASSAVSAIGFILLLLLRSDMRRYFASKEDLKELDCRVDQMREQAVTQQRASEARHSRLEADFAGLTATLAAVQRDVSGIDRNVSMLVNHLLDRERS